MRNQSKMLNSFMPIHEKDYEARLFIDDAIKGKSEYALEAIAKALSGVNDIRLNYRNEPFVHTKHIAGDNGDFITVTKKYPIEATMNSFCFYGRTPTEIWVKIIKFWAVNETIFPCGGAAFPNRAKNIENAAKDAPKTIVPENGSEIPE